MSSIINNYISQNRKILIIGTPEIINVVILGMVEFGVLMRLKDAD